MKYIYSSQELKIPKGGKLVKNLQHLAISFKQTNRDSINIEMHHGARKSVACLRTVRSLIENMITGVTKGFKYKMRYVYAHFPINVNIDNNKETGVPEVEIRNFIGEKLVRRIAMAPGVEVAPSKNQKDQLEVSGNSLEDVSQSAASIQQACRVRNKDIRKFLDGLYANILLSRLIVTLKHESQNATAGAGIPDPARPALLTLHLIYPHILLDALDLLDRGCVIKLNVSGSAESSVNRREKNTSHGAGKDDHANTRDFGTLTQQRHDIVSEMNAADDDDVDMPDSPTAAASAQESAELISAEPQASEDKSSSHEQSHIPGSTQSYSTYFVRSAVPPPSRFATSDADPFITSKGYAIHLLAWNCSCPAFALAAFSDGMDATNEARERLGDVMKGEVGRSGQGRGGQRTNVLRDEMRGELSEALRFGFGGLDAFCKDHGGEIRVKDGREGLPACCKHLLACVLAEAMPSVFTMTAARRQGERPAEASAKGVLQQWVDNEEAAGWAAGAGFGL
ncbi:MAG: hypothetical protein Q9159_003292 [Coniocarpon cinnabarinum]